MEMFLSERKIKSPAVIAFATARDYIEWRTSRIKKTGKTVCRNTAIAEVKLFAMVMDRAVNLGLATRNPLVRLGLKKDDADEKPEISDAEFAAILPALDDEPEWMRLSFLISMHTGCRLRETRIRMTSIDFKRGTLSFENPKGGRGRAFTIPIPCALRAVLMAIKDGRKHTLEFPFQPSRQWGHFFRRMGMRHLCFHCLRVTFITRLARAAVPMPLAMRLVNHASSAIHKVYQRLSVEDVRGVSLNLFAGIEQRSNDQTGEGKEPRP